MILFAIAALLAFAFLVGVVTSSTGVSIMATYAVFFFSALLAGHDRIAAAVSKQWQANLVNALYWIFPKTAELGRSVVALVSATPAVTGLSGSSALLPFATTAAFALVCLGLAATLFQRKDF